MVDTLASIGKVTPYLSVQNLAMSLSVPGSWPPKSLAGTPRTTRPWSLYFS